MNYQRKEMLSLLTDLKNETIKHFNINKEVEMKKFIEHKELRFDKFFRMITFPFLGLLMFKIFTMSFSFSYWGSAIGWLLTLISSVALGYFSNKKREKKCLKEFLFFPDLIEDMEYFNDEQEECSKKLYAYSLPKESYLYFYKRLGKIIGEDDLKMHTEFVVLEEKNINIGNVYIIMKIIKDSIEHMKFMEEYNSQRVPKEEFLNVARRKVLNVLYEEL